MKITIEFDTENTSVVRAHNEDNSLCMEYTDICLDELYLEEILNDFLT